jgi:hypothetical protein
MQRKRDPKSGPTPEQEKPVVTISSVVIASEEVTQSREILVTDLPAHWVDGLLAAMCELPVATGEVGAVQSIIDALKRMMPAISVGATIVREGETRVLRAASVAPDAIPPGASRMFPHHAHERTVELHDAVVTLHLASD